MKKLIASLSILLFTGCSLLNSFTYMSEIDYFNTYVDHFNLIAEDLDNAMSDYFYYVPENVTVETEVVFYGSYYAEAKLHVDNAREVIFSDEMTIADSDKEIVLEALAENYFDAFDDFLAIYDEAADYYSDDSYKDSIEYLALLDANIINQYDVVSTLQYEFSELLNEYQVEARGELNEDSTDPVEKIGVSITILTDTTDDIVNLLYLWDFENPQVAEVRGFYDDLIAKHAEEASEVVAIYDSAYESLFAGFEDNYLAALTAFEVEVETFVLDAEAGLVTLDTSYNYDSLFYSYDDLITAHNAMVDLLNEVY